MKMEVRSAKSEGRILKPGLYQLNNQWLAGKDARTLVEMKPATFVTEDDFQRLLADFPLLLAGCTGFNSAKPRKWLLVSREMSIASQQDGAGRWAVDHLFLDQDGIPTLVEVKRQSDTRIGGRW